MYMDREEFAKKLEEIVMKNINNQADIDEQGELIEKLMKESRAKKNKNKRAHFLTEICILIITSSIGVVNALILINTHSFDILSVLSIILPAILTIILGLQNIKKHKETWLRHQKTYSKYQMESIKYIYQLGDYQNYPKDIMTKEYLSNILNIGSQNSNQFEKNMETEKSRESKKGM